MTLYNRFYYLSFLLDLRFYGCSNSCLIICGTFYNVKTFAEVIFHRNIDLVTGRCCYRLENFSCKDFLVSWTVRLTLLFHTLDQRLARSFATFRHTNRLTDNYPFTLLLNLLGVNFFHISVQRLAWSYTTLRHTNGLTDNHPVTF